MADRRPSNPSVARPRSHRRTTLLSACLLLLIGVIAPLAQQRVDAEGGEAEGGLPIASTGYRANLAPMLSSASYSALYGMDPRVYAPATGREAPSTWSESSFAPSGGGSTRAGAAQQVPFRNPAPSFSRNLIVTKQLGLFPIQTEPQIAVDPNDPEHLILGVIDYNFPSMSTYVSWDGGETWEGPHQVRFFRDDQTAAGDPVIAFDRDGSAYITFISLGFEEFRIGTILSATEVSSMAISKSVDGGYTWTDAVSAARGLPSTASNPDAEGRERGVITLPFLDKPWIDVGPDPENPENDILYLTYTDFSSQYTVIYSDELPYLSTLR